MFLQEKELIEAITEWCAKRGVNLTKENKMVFSARKGGHSYPSNAPYNYKFDLSIYGVELPVRDGPYR